MKKAVVAGIAVLALVGCAENGSTAESANAAACAQFADATRSMFSAFGTDRDAGEAAWEKSRDDFSEAAAAGSGEVQEQMSDLVEKWPELADIGFSSQTKAIMNDRLAIIAAACNSDGISVDYSEFGETN